MAGATPPPRSDPPSFRPEETRAGVADLEIAALGGLLGQILIWGSVIALWVFGSLYGNIPTRTSIAYGANGFSVSAGAIFGLNYLLIGGAVVTALALLLTGRDLRRIAGATPLPSLEAAASLATVGAIGFGLFALGWGVWIGSFVPPVAGAAPSYTSVMDSNLAAVVDLMLIAGGLLAFVGMLGLAWGSSQLGGKFDESALELGGALSALPVFSTVGYVLLMIGLVRADRKVRQGWVPSPPPPPPPLLHYVAYPAVYASGGPLAPSRDRPSWDGLAVALVVVVVLLWVLIVPISLVITSEDSLTHGPASSAGSPNGSPAGASATTSAGSPFAVLLLGLAATAVLVPLALVRNRRKRQKSSSPSPSPPPPPPPPPAADEDALDHLV